MDSENILICWWHNEIYMIYSAAILCSAGFCIFIFMGYPFSIWFRPIFCVHKPIFCVWMWLSFLKRSYCNMVGGHRIHTCILVLHVLSLLALKLCWGMLHFDHKYSSPIYCWNRCFMYDYPNGKWALKFLCYHDQEGEEAGEVTKQMLQGDASVVVV